MSMAEVREGLAMIRAGYAKLAAASMDPLTATELLEVGDELETLTCQLPTQRHRMLARLQTETTARALGAKSWNNVLTVRWRLSSGEAGRRLTEAALLGPRRGLTGEPLDPVLPATAAAVALGAINADHVKEIRTSLERLPGHVGAADRTQIEVDWVRTAAGVGPTELKGAIKKALFLMDQDGPEPDDTERQRKRGLSAGKQGRDAMTPFTGHLTPEAWATWEPILAKYAAPGMCNPADPLPCTSGTPTQAQIDNDDRSLAQRQHDAFIAVGRIALMSEKLGKLNGLPVSIIIRTTLQDLESRAGVGTTGGGAIMPIADVIRLAGHANHYLAVFDGATGSAMDLFRTKRIASADQRIMLVARDGGCTKPCCSVGVYGCQVHHVVADWADDGQTNVDDLGLACGPDNRMVDKDGGWTTRMNERHEVEWIPPPHLDNGQTRINTIHRPEPLLRPPDDEPVEPENDTAAAEPDQDEACRDPDTLDPWASDKSVGTAESTPPEPNNGESVDPGVLDPWGYIPVEPAAEPDTRSPDPPDDPWGGLPIDAQAEKHARRIPEALDPWGIGSPAESGGPPLSRSGDGWRLRMRTSRRGLVFRYLRNSCSKIRRAPGSLSARSSKKPGT